jgi:hypothetical protein
LIAKLQRVKNYAKYKQQRKQITSSAAGRKRHGFITQEATVDSNILDHQRGNKGVVPVWNLELNPEDFTEER